MPFFGVFGSILAPIWELRGCPGEARKFDDFGTPIGFVLGPLFSENWELFRSLNFHCFLDRFFIDF